MRRFCGTLLGFRTPFKGSKSAILFRRHELVLTYSISTVRAAQGSKRTTRSEEQSPPLIEAQHRDSVRHLEALYQDGILDRPQRDSERARRISRPPNEDVRFNNDTPWHKFAQDAPSGEAGVDYARETMKRFHSTLVRMPVEEAQSKIVATGLGRQIFEWLLGSQDSVKKACGSDFELLQLLAHYLIAENQWSNALAELGAIMRTIPPIGDFEKRKESRVQYAWIGRLLGKLSELRLARDGRNGNANAVLKLAISLAHMQNQFPGARSVHPTVITLSITHHIFRTSLHNTDPELFSQYFEAYYAHFDASRLPRKWFYNRAAVLLMLPGNRDPEPLLEHFRSIHTDDSAEIWHPTSFKEAHFAWTLALDLSSYLASQGRDVDSAWANAFAAKLKVVRDTLNAQKVQTKFARSPGEDDRPLDQRDKERLRAAQKSQK